MATMDDLREKLSVGERYTEYLGEQYCGEVSEFTVDDEKKANWALRKLMELEMKKKSNEELARDEKAKVMEFAASEMLRIDQWLKKKNEEIDHSIEFFQSHLSAYLSRLRQDDPKLKRLYLPNGWFGTRKKPAKWIYKDESQVLAGLKANGRTDLIRTKEMVDKQALKKALKIVDGRAVDPETGWIVEGIEIDDPGEVFWWGVSE